MIRRDFLKSCGALAAGTALGSPFASAAVNAQSPEQQPGALNDLTLPIRSLKPDVKRQISVIVIGCGSRGNVYSRYAEMFPDAM